MEKIIQDDLARLVARNEITKRTVVDLGDKCSSTEDY